MKCVLENRRAVIYCRVSTKEQVENLSLETQERACREYCQREGIEVIGVFVDKGESAKTVNRPEFQKMIKFCQKHKGKIVSVIVHSVSRFSRDNHDHQVVRALLHKLKIELRSVTEPIDDSSVGRFTENILAAVAQFENDQKSERVKVGMKAAREKGIYVQKPPIGYRKPRKGSSMKSLEPDPVAGPLIRKALEMFATGRYSRDEIRRKINKLGLRTKHGNPLSAQTFYFVLKNPVYKGRVLSRINGTDDDGDFEPLVSEEIFNRVQAILKGKVYTPTAHHLNHPDFPLRRFVRCGKCDTVLTGSMSKGRNRKYPYYWCRNPQCMSRIRKEVLEKKFLDLLGSLKLKLKYAGLFKAIIQDRWSEIQAENIKSKKMIEKKLEELSRKRELLDEAFIYEKNIEKETYNEHLRKIKGEMESLELELAANYSSEDFGLDIEGIMRFTERTIMNADSLWKELPLEPKLKLQRVLFPQGVAFDGSAFRTAENNSIFNYLNIEKINNKKMAVPTGFEPVLPA